jgi:hypothetical protein
MSDDERKVDRVESGGIETGTWAHLAPSEFMPLGIWIQTGAPATYDERRAWDEYCRSIGLTV